MTSGDQTFRAIQNLARSLSAKNHVAAPTQELLIRHLLESFLHRLLLTSDASDFVLKGGLLCTAYGSRRPTRDVDANAIRADVSTSHIQDVIQRVCSLKCDDGVAFSPNDLSLSQIRDGDEYPGLRVRLPATIGPWAGMLTWDVSTGDPVVPPPTWVSLPRVLGDPIRLLAYPPEAVVAEKSVTLLERGLSNTRWRDLVDIDQLCKAGLNESDLERSIGAVLNYRAVEPEAITSTLRNYGALHQPKWAAWRRKERLEEITEPLLDDEVKLISNWIDPILKRFF